MRKRRLKKRKMSHFSHLNSTRDIQKKEKFDSKEEERKGQGSASLKLR